MPHAASCTLGSINLSAVVDEGKVNYEKFAHLIDVAYNFLDTSQQRAWFPIEKCRIAARKYRNIGIGVMGLADMLIKLGIRYDSQEAVDLSRELGEYLRRKSVESAIKKYGKDYPNETLTSIAPTGSISMLADCSSGIEPIFSKVVYKKTYVGDFEMHHELADMPAFVTTNEIEPRWHVAHLAAWQESIDNGCSKTLNLPNSATVEEVYELFMSCWALGCKSATVYRDGSRSVQVLNSEKQDGSLEERMASANRERCPECQSSNVQISPKCTTCYDCGFSGCSI